LSIAAWTWAVRQGLIPAGVAEAADWNRPAFEAKTLPEAYKTFGVTMPVESKDIVIKAPDIAENGAVVPIEISSKIPGTKSLTIFAEKNPQPLVASFEFAEGVETYVSTRIKLGETSHVRVVAHAGGKFYLAAKEIKVTIGGCG
jgi:sulfur-oxidizing protein SoxY